MNHRPDDPDECPRCWDHNSKVVEKTAAYEKRKCNSCKNEWTVMAIERAEEETNAGST